MKLLSMTATFGRLDRATLTCADGLNLLELPNEGGKSTWCAFLQAMFYGLESRRGRGLSERNRHTPWSGAPMSGTVDLLWRGKAITLRRFPKGVDPFGGFQAVYTGTEEPVPGLTADNAGETLLGVSKEAFQRTCFIPQGRVQVDASGDLERRVAALAGAGEEDVSYSQAYGRLKEWRNARQSNRANGALPKLRERLAQTQAKRQQLLDARGRAAQAQGDLIRLDKERQTLESDLARHAQLEEANARAAARARYESAAQRLARSEEALDAARTEEEAAKGRIPPAPGRSGKLPLALTAGIIALIALGLCALLLARRSAWALAPGILALAALAGAAVAWRLIARRDAAALAAHQAAEDAWAEAQKAAQTAQDEHIAARAAWEAISAQGEPPAPPAVHDLPRWPLAQDEADRARIAGELERCRARLARAQGEEEALGGLEPLEEAQAALEREIAAEEERLAVLNLAMDALTAANAQLQTRFSPVLNAKAGELLSRLTGGRYTATSFTRDFQASAQGDDGLRDTQLLSQGAADQVYLALRLAICLLALPEEDPPFLLLDDALCSFDDTRLRLALDLLDELAKTRQILLFTCHGRERLALGR